MTGDSGDSSSDFSAKPSCSRRITSRRSKNAAASCSSSSKTGGGGGGVKRKPRFVMRIEFDDDSEESSTTSSSISDDDGRTKRTADKKKNTNLSNMDDDEIKPCSSRKLRGKLGKKTNFVFSSEAEDSSSSGDDVPGGGTRRRRSNLRNRQRLEHDDSDGGGPCTGSEIARRSRNPKKAVISEDDDDSEVAPSTSQPNREEENGFNSDSSSNELLEKCPICLLTFRTQEIGSPATCEHIFCANCIEAWSKNVQTCPIDRIEFERIIVRESYENRELVREINVSKTDGAEKLNQDISDEDITHCEVCNRTDREDVMLLCDSCNQGYHIDCLSPALPQVPEGSWYCDNCFDSENGDDTDMAEDLNELYEDIRDMGIPESRYRVTEVHQPRILRTRQNERIRAAILSRTRASTRNPNTDSAPASSRTASTSRSARTVRNSSRTTRTRRRRRRRPRQRTYVVEYDLNNFDEKFAIKTTKRVIRRRRRRRNRRTVRSCRQTETSGERMTASKRLAEQLGVKSTDREARSAASSQSFSLFGNANDLEYFSDSDDGGRLQSEIQIETGGGGTAAVQTSVRISNFRTHRSKKGLLSRLEREQPSSTPDLLSNIMDLQDRWHNASRHLDAVRIGQDGSLNLPPPSAGGLNPTFNSTPAVTPSPMNTPNPANTLSPANTQPSNPVNASDVTQAPMYPRGGGGNNRNFNSGGGGNSGGGNYNNRYNNQSNYRGGGGGGGGNSGGGQYRSSFGSSSSSGTGGSGITGGNLFNMVGRGNFSFSSPNFNQNQTSDNNTANNPPNNRDRFNQRNNNRNNRNSLPLFNNNQSNDNLSSLNVNQAPVQQMNQSHLQQQQRQLIPIQTVQTIQPPPQFQIPTLQQHQTTQIRQVPVAPLQPPAMPPVGLFNNLPPTSAPPPMFGPPNMPPIPPPILSQPPPIIPIRQQPPVAVATALPPLAAPPAFNSSLFQLTADYGNDDDDDSNCPNFSVYSMESLQVAKSDVKAAAESKGDTPKEDDENEDLVQLSDDDETMATLDEEIPLPPTDNNKSDSGDESANKDSELYEPDQPTVETDDESADNDPNKDDDIESQTSPENDMELESQDTSENVLARPHSETCHDHDENEESEKEADTVKSAEKAKAADGEEDDERLSLSDIKLPEETPKVKRFERKGVLELYDDSDWEELNMERPTAEDYKLKTPPQEPNKSPENDKEKDDELEDGEVEGDEKDEDKAEESEAHSPAQPRPSSSAQEEKADEQEDDDKEQDRSYTPCLDEKNDNIDDNDEEGACTPEMAGPSTSSNNLNEANDANTPDLAAASDAAGIGGMETELISEEDDADKRDKNKRGKGKDKDKDKEKDKDKDKDKEQFKKISKNQKDRNYRSEKQLNEVRPKQRRRRSRSRTNDKENQGMSHRRAQRGRFKRRELPRYNVRNVVNQQRSFKDRYGRDTSRPARSTSRPPRRRRSFSRSVSRSKSRSRSLSSPAKRARRSFSISPTPPRFPPNRRQTISPRRRSNTPMRSPVRRQSRTPLRMRSRSNTPIRRLNKHKPKRGPGKRSISPVNRARSLSRFTPRLSRSRTPPRHKAKRPKERKKKKNKRRQASPSPRGSHANLSRHRDSVPPPTKRKRHHTPKEKSPVADQGWSPSPSPPRNYMHDNISWTPPLMSPAGVSRLRRNEEYNEFSIPSKPPKEKKKRDKKKKKSEKRRGEAPRKEKRRREQGSAPSKEVFASGNNILVSVSFNKDGNQPQQTTVVTLPPTREEVLASIRGRSKERQTDQQGKKKKKKDGRKRKKLDTKPVAIIDLERSPFQVTQEQADIIVLTDSEGGGHDDENLNVSRESANEMITEMDHHHPREGSSHRTVNSDKTPPLDRLEAMMEESYENAIQQQGPKTPPEPPGGIKFNLINKNKQKAIRNALHDEAELEFDEQQEEERQEDRDTMTQGTNKIGPNTPPESGPCSPDVYDPFDPTKSPSMSPRSPTPPPDMSHDSVADADVPSKHSTEDLRTEPRVPVSSGPTASEKSALNPVDLVMALMNNKTNSSQDSANKSNESQYNSGQAVVNLVDENDKPEENSSSLGITVLSNVILSSGKSQHIPSISSPPLSKASSQMHKPPQKITNILSGLPGLSNRHNGGGVDDLVINDIESPYSPGSADYEDLFEPPPDTNGGTKRRREKRANKGGGVGDIFENLFGTSSPPATGASHNRLSRKHKTAHARNKHKMIVKVSKLPGSNTDDHVKVYDDLPNSAVELQVKDKFLRKLNRQERVVEEVKMILKPRFNKKQITKDDYKEIMRRAVPKICHSKSGEINPKKIQNLIEAYVRKFRQKHKKLNIPNTGQVSSAVKCAAYLKKL